MVVWRLARQGCGYQRVQGPLRGFLRRILLVKRLGKGGRAERQALAGGGLKVAIEQFAKHTAITLAADQNGLERR